jgi:retron-type reverse transcriptase
LSPLLANIALNGIEELGKGIRYADDCVFILKPEDDADKLLASIAEFLAKHGKSNQPKECTYQKPMANKDH